MTEGFDWVPFHEEMAQRLRSYRDRQIDLVEILRASGIGGIEDRNKRDEVVDLTEIDPFTFLAMLNKQSAPERTRALVHVKQHLGLAADVPVGFLGIPKADARQTWLFPYLSERNANDVSKLWDLYEAVLSGGQIDEGIFAAARAVKYAGKAKLTQAIFRAAPNRFFPVDGQTVGYLAGLRLANEFDTAKELQEISDQVRRRVAKPLYEQSHDAWLLNHGAHPNAESRYQQKVLDGAARQKPFVEPPGGVLVPKVTKAGLSREVFQRDPNVAAEALRMADFKCEIDPDHQTFISNASGKPYLEAHHLIPFGKQGTFAFSLDVTANIVALCPNCHRLLHHGQEDDKAREISTLFSKRRDRLAEKSLQVSKAKLLALYRGDRLHDDF
jgi:5-methylcytosine-specific restriction protein A